jgi:hypothetical protein
MKSLEVLIKGDELSEFWMTFRMGNSVCDAATGK